MNSDADRPDDHVEDLLVGFLQLDLDDQQLGVVGSSETGGMAPWGEWVDIGPATATYEVWMNGVTYTFEYTQTERQLDFVYDEVRLGHFHEYQVIPFADGEEVDDDGTVVAANG